MATTLQAVIKRAQIMVTSSASTSNSLAETPETHLSLETSNHSIANNNDDDFDGNDIDDEEQLFAELDKEVEEMENQDNYLPNFPAPQFNVLQDESGWREGFNLAEFREKRIQELDQEIAKRKQADNRSVDPGSSLKGHLNEITNEKELIHISAQEPRVAIHFYHPKFQRCKLLDRHLHVLAQLHPTTLFVKANVLNAPFLVTKLNVKVLPCLITFKDGVSKDKMVGFQELGNSDKFTTGALEWRLGQSGILNPRNNQKPILGFADNHKDSVGVGVVGAGKATHYNQNNDDDDGFWDDD